MSERMTDAQRVDRWIGKLMNATKSEDAYIAKDVINNAFEDKEDRIAELEAQAELDKAEINAAFNNAEMFAERIAELQAENKMANIHINELKADLAKAKLSNVGMHNTIARMTHRNGVECVHGKFLHEDCPKCRGEVK